MPPKNANMQKIFSICEAAAARLGYELCDAAMEKEPTGRYLRIYIDTDSGVTLDDCEKYHRAVQPALENFDYDFLEVCSPGIERALSRPEHFAASIGAEVELSLYAPYEGSRKVRGKLAAYEDGDLTVTVGEKDVAFKKADVAKVRTVFREGKD